MEHKIILFNRRRWNNNTAKKSDFLFRFPCSLIRWFPSNFLWRVTISRSKRWCYKTACTEANYRRRSSNPAILHPSRKTSPSKPSARSAVACSRAPLIWIGTCGRTRGRGPTPALTATTAAHRSALSIGISWAYIERKWLWCNSASLFDSKNILVFSFL